MRTVTEKQRQTYTDRLMHTCMHACIHSHVHDIDIHTLIATHTYQHTLTYKENGMNLVLLVTNAQKKYCEYSLYMSG